MIKFALILGLLAGLYGGFGAGQYWNRNQMQKEAVEIGLAHYHPASGEWQWGVYDGGVNLAEKLPENMFLNAQKEPKKAAKK